MAIMASITGKRILSLRINLKPRDYWDAPKSFDRKVLFIEFLPNFVGQ